MYTKEDVIQYIENEDVRFIRLSFFSLAGIQKNISIQPSEIYKAFDLGIPIDGSRVFDMKDSVDLYLIPDPNTMCIIPWRSFDGTVLRLYCDIYTADGKPFDLDVRGLLKRAVEHTKQHNLSVSFAAKFEFYLFHMDEQGDSTGKPLDHAGYMDISPDDKGEDVRRQICYYLNGMGMGAESSHHEAGPGQNEIDFHASSPLVAADEAGTFKWIVRTVAQSHGLYADFSPKPLQGEAGNAMIVRIGLEENAEAFTAGILAHLREMTCFMNPGEESYERLGKLRAPRLIGASANDLKKAVRILDDREGKHWIELRSPDNLCNPYIVYALLLYAGVKGIEEQLTFRDMEELLPSSLEEAGQCALNSAFIQSVLPSSIISFYCR